MRCYLNSFKPPAGARNLVRRHDAAENADWSAHKASPTMKKASGSSTSASPKGFRHSGGTQLFSFCDADARSTSNPPACAEPPATHPSDRAHSDAPGPGGLQPTIGRLDPDRGEYRSANTSVSSSTRRPAAGTPYPVNSKTNLPSRVCLIGHCRRNGHSAHADSGISTRVVAVAVSCEPSGRSPGAGVDRASPLVEGEVVDRQRRGSAAVPAGDRTNQIDAPHGGGLNVLIAV